MARKPITKAKADQSPSRSKTLHRRSDSWTNLLTGAGIAGRDKLQSSFFRLRAPLNYASEEVFALYRQNWLAKRLVDDLCGDAVRCGWVVQSADDQELTRSTAEAWKKLNALEKMQDGLRWALVCGGAVGLILTDDTPLVQASASVFATPLDTNTLRNVLQVVVIDARYALPNLSAYTADPNSPNFGLPEIYTVTPYGNSTASPSYQVHWSRLLRFEGIPTDMLTRVGNLLWGDPIYEAAWDPLMRYGMAYQGAAVCVAEFGTKILKMKDLAALMDGEDYQKILNRVSGVKLSLGAYGMALLDAEFEELESMAVAVSGLHELLNEFKKEVVGVTREPESRLYGNQAGKLSGANEDHRLWAEYVHSWQMGRLFKPLHRLTELIYLSKEGPTKGKLPDGWTIAPLPIDPPDLDRELEQRERQAKIDQAYFGMGVLEPGETRESRFGGPAYSHETTLDPAVTAAIKANDLAAAKDNDKALDQTPPSEA